MNPIPPGDPANLHTIVFPLQDRTALGKSNRLVDRIGPDDHIPADRLRNLAKRSVGDHRMPADDPAVIEQQTLASDIPVLGCNPPIQSMVCFIQICICSGEAIFDPSGCLRININSSIMINFIPLTSQGRELDSRKKIILYPCPIHPASIHM